MGKLGRVDLFSRGRERFVFVFTCQSNCTLIMRSLSRVDAAGERSERNRKKRTKLLLFFDNPSDSVL